MAVTFMLLTNLFSFDIVSTSRKEVQGNHDEARTNPGFQSSDGIL